jgi:hypothetical protein
MWVDPSVMRDPAQHESLYLKKMWVDPFFIFFFFWISEMFDLRKCMAVETMALTGLKEMV